MALGNALTEFLGNLAAIDGNPDLPDDFMRALARGWQAIAYSATELFEAYSINLKGALGLNDKARRKTTKTFDEIVKSRRDHWSFLANKIKHNGNELVTVSYRYVPSGRIVHGYSLVRPVGSDAKEVNKQYHKGRERALSFDLELRQLVADLLHVDRAAQFLVESLPDDQGVDSLPDYQTTWQIGPQLQKIAVRPLRSVPLQSRMVDGFQIVGDILTVSRQTAEIINEATYFQNLFTGDGITRTFPII